MRRKKQGIAGRGRKMANSAFYTDRGAKRSHNGHRSPAGAVSIGPSALDRRSSAVRSSVPSRHCTGWQPAIPRPHRCRPPELSRHVWHALRGQSGRMRSLGAARQRLWPAWEAPERRCRARQRPRDGALSRVSAEPARCAHAQLLFFDGGVRRAATIGQPAAKQPRAS